MILELGVLLASANDTFTANSNSSITINTTSSTTLTQLRDSINNATDNAEATILYNGTGYVLVIKGKSGASNEVKSYSRRRFFFRFNK